MNILSDAIQMAVKERVQREVDMIVEHAHNHFNSIIPEIVSGIMINFQKRISLERYNSEIIIRIEDKRHG